MNTRQTLHELQLAPDPLTVMLENAPIDDEPDDDDFDGGLTEALGETELIPHEEVKRRYLK